MNLEFSDGLAHGFCSNCDECVPIDLMIPDSGRYFCQSCCNPQLIQKSLIQPTKISERSVLK